MWKSWREIKIDERFSKIFEWAESNDEDSVEKQEATSRLFMLVDEWAESKSELIESVCVVLLGDIMLLMISETQFLFEQKIKLILVLKLLINYEIKDKS